MDRNTDSASYIAVDGVAFNAACDTETGRHRIWDDSNDLGPAMQDQIRFPRVRPPTRRESATHTRSSRGAGRGALEMQ